MDQKQNNFRLPEQNSVVLVGRLTRDPELRRTNTGKAVCSFDIAVGRRMKDPITGEWKDADPTFVPIVVWGDQAERCGERLKKGFPVHVEGRLQTNKWEGTDGIKRSRLEVVASRVQFLSIVKHDDVAVGVSSAKHVEEDVNVSELHGQIDNGTNALDDDDIPF